MIKSPVRLRRTPSRLLRDRLFEKGDVARRLSAKKKSVQKGKMIIRINRGAILSCALIPEKIRANLLNWCKFVDNKTFPARKCLFENTPPFRKGGRGEKAFG